MNNTTTAQKWAKNGGITGALAALAIFIDVQLGGVLSLLLVEPNTWLAIKAMIFGFIGVGGAGGAVAAAKDRVKIGRVQEQPQWPKPEPYPAPNIAPPAPSPTIKSPVDMALLRADLTRDEGTVYKIYLDSEGHKTAGKGHKLNKSDPEYNLPVGTDVPEARVDEWFSQDVTTAVRDAEIVVDNLWSHPEPVIRAMINMAFNMGREGLSEFTETLRLLSDREYIKASLEALNSLWSDQVGKRADRVAALIASGAKYPS